MLPFYWEWRQGKYEDGKSNKKLNHHKKYLVLNEISKHLLFIF